MQIKPFTPIESQNPLYLGSSDELFVQILKEHNGQTAAEIKEDGYRMQIHKQGTRIEAYTRSMKQIILELFPELHSSLENLPDCIIDTELIGANKIGLDGFNAIKRRFRHRISQKGIEEYLGSDLPKDFPVSLRVFDTLYWEGEPLIDLPLSERREYTASIDELAITPSTQRLITDPQELEHWFTSLTDNRYEGLVCKRPDSLYLPGKRTKDWIKIKRSETVDAVVLGVYMEGTRISQILCGTYNPETRMYETLAKVNAKREGMDKELHPLLKDKYTDRCPKNVSLNPNIPEEQMPDYFIQPRKSAVVEVSAMNFHYSKNWQSCGLANGKAYSLRIGWLKSIRYDKNPSQVSTSEDVKELYKKERDG